MKFERRIRLLEALVAAQEAIAEATRLVLEQEPLSEDPAGVVRELTKTGPRLPFVLPDDRPSQRATKPDTTYAVNSHTAHGHLKRAFRDAQTIEDRVRVRKIAKKLVEQGLVTDEQLESLMKEKP